MALVYTLTTIGMVLSVPVAEVSQPTNEPIVSITMVLNHLNSSTDIAIQLELKLPLRATVMLNPGGSQGERLGMSLITQRVGHGPIPVQRDVSQVVVETISGQGRDRITG